MPGAVHPVQWLDSRKRSRRCSSIPRAAMSQFYGLLHGGAVAQRVERWTCDQQVVVSNHTRGKAA